MRGGPRAGGGGELVAVGLIVGPRLGGGGGRLGWGMPGRASGLRPKVVQGVRGELGVRAQSQADPEEFALSTAGELPPAATER